MSEFETVRIKNYDSTKNFLYALQWLGFAMANLMVVPVIVGSALGLDSAATVSRYGLEGVRQTFPGQ